MRTVGVISRGIRAPIIKKGDDLADLVTKTVLYSAKNEGYALCDRDVVGITESVVARRRATTQHWTTLRQMYKINLGKMQLLDLFCLF